MGQVQEARRHPGNPAIGGHIVQPDRDQCQRPIGPEPQFQPRRPQNLEALGQHRPGEHQRARVILALIAGPVGILAIAPDLTRAEADPERRVDLRHPCTGPAAQSAARVQRQHDIDDAR